MRHKLGFLLFILAAAVLFNNCSKSNSAELNAESTLQNTKAIPVEVQTVRKTEWKEIVSSYGTIKTRDKVEIFSKMPGKLIRLLVKEEQKIQNGDVVAVVERDEVGLSYKPVEVKATASGKVETIYLKEGAKVSDMTPILALAKPDDLKLVVSIFENDFPKVHLGQQTIITMDALPDREFTGKVSLIKPNLDAHSGKGEIEITFDRNYIEVMPGMFGRAKINNGRRTTLTIVPESLKKIKGLYSVYVVENGKVRLIPVEIGSQNADAIEVKSGISAGSKVVTFASDDLKENDSVKIVGEKK